MNGPRPIRQGTLLTSWRAARFKHDRPWRSILTLSSSGLVRPVGARRCRPPSSRKACWWWSADGAGAGWCVHTGTIPSKTLPQTVLNLSGWRERGFYGRAHWNKDDITAEDLRRRLHITLDHQVEVLEHQLGPLTIGLTDRATAAATS